VRRADHLSRGVLLTVMRRCLWSRNLVNEEVLAHWELSHPPKIYKLINMYICFVCVCVCE